MTTIAGLNARLGLEGVLTFKEGIDGVPIAAIANDSAAAEIALFGGHVLSYIPQAETQDALFVSPLATTANGKAIRGGVPICWPWFGPDPEGKGRPSHGFARNRMWNAIASQAIDASTTKLTLGLGDTDETRAIWPYGFELTLDVTVGASLTLELTTRNASEANFTLTQALHTYFTVGDINRVTVRGLEGKYYFDKVDGGAKKFQSDAIAIEREVDRIYLDVAPEQVIDDAALDRRIRITSTGNTTDVVWNPWIEKAASMGDLPDAAYTQMLCVETTNAADDTVTIAPNESFCLGAVYTVER